MVWMVGFEPTNPYGSAALRDGIRVLAYILARGYCQYAKNVEAIM